MIISDDELFGNRRGTISVVGQEGLVDEIIEAYTSLRSNRRTMFEGSMIEFLGTYCVLQPADMIALFNISQTLDDKEYAMKLQFIAAIMFYDFVREAKRDRLGMVIIDARFLAAKEIFAVAQATFGITHKNERGHPIAVALRELCRYLER